MLKLSVIICTHNPRVEYLEKTFEALKSQQTELKYWELLLIDNCSSEDLSAKFKCLWHPNYRCIRENKIGLTAARLRGIAEAKADLLLFVDDDNCLKADYLDIVLNKMNAFPELGVIGAGKIIPDFEIKPEKELEPYMIMLALRSEERAHYSNEVILNRAIPFGAGLSIRRSLALKYVESNSIRRDNVLLGRSGGELLSGEDIDLALHACAEGYIAAVFPELELIHIIPKKRLERNYLLKLAAGHAASHYLLSKVWKYNVEYDENPVLKMLRHWKKMFAKSGFSKQIYLAEYKAVNSSRRKWSKLV